MKNTKFYPLLLLLFSSFPLFSLNSVDLFNAKQDGLAAIRAGNFDLAKNFITSFEQIGKKEVANDLEIELLKAQLGIERQKSAVLSFSHGNEVNHLRDNLRTAQHVLEQSLDVQQQLEQELNRTGSVVGRNPIDLNGQEQSEINFRMQATQINRLREERDQARGQLREFERIVEEMEKAKDEELLKAHTCLELLSRRLQQRESSQTGTPDTPPISSEDHQGYQELVAALRTCGQELAQAKQEIVEVQDASRQGEQENLEMRNLLEEAAQELVQAEQQQELLQEKDEQLRELQQENGSLREQLEQYQAQMQTMAQRLTQVTPLLAGGYRTLSSLQAHIASAQGTAQDENTKAQLGQAVAEAKQLTGVFTQCVRALA